MLVAAAFLVTMLGATLPTPLYPLYQQELGFGGLMVTVVFAMYAVGVLAALLVVGRLSDEVGRRAVLLPALGVAAASSLAFLVPHSLAALIVGRLLSGVSQGRSPGSPRPCSSTWPPPGSAPAPGCSPPPSTSSGSVSVRWSPACWPTTRRTRWCCPTCCTSRWSRSRRGRWRGGPGRASRARGPGARAGSAPVSRGGDGRRS